MCLVVLRTGVVPVSLHLGSISSVGLSRFPHASHWSPRASCASRQTPIKIHSCIARGVNTRDRWLCVSNGTGFHVIRKGTGFACCGWSVCFPRYPDTCPPPHKIRWLEMGFNLTPVSVKKDASLVRVPLWGRTSRGVHRFALVLQGAIHLPTWPPLTPQVGEALLVRWLERDAKPEKNGCVLMQQLWGSRFGVGE